MISWTVPTMRSGFMPTVLHWDMCTSLIRILGTEKQSTALSRRRSAAHRGVYTSGTCTVSSTVERAFGYLKDEFGARHVRVRGYQKVVCTCVRRARAHRGSIATDGPINRIRACMQNLGTLNYRCLGIGVENAHRSSTKFTPLTPHWSQITGRFLGSTEPIAIIHAIWAN